MQGIYQIRNIENNKIYIGSSVDIERRWKDHKRDLNNNKHINYKLQNDWNSYGEDKFEFEMLETNNDVSRNEILTLEQKYLDDHKPHESGYNIAYKVNSIPLRNEDIEIEKIHSEIIQHTDDFETEGVLRRIGNSKGVLMPAKILNAMNLSEGDKIVIRYEEGRIIIDTSQGDREKKNFEKRVITIIKKYLDSQSVENI